ncbi:MFS general substrate transporter [Lactifluus volemus]|nr:MFS general substrate transporter [Lactifluus volemus]
MSTESTGGGTYGFCEANGNRSVAPSRDSKQSATAHSQAEKLYSVFSHREKWLIVGIASYAGLFSPLTTNIYFPAIPVMSKEFHKSLELINLTVTLYMVMQGLFPMIWGTISDYWGRRPIMLACLTTLALSCVGLALVPTSSYWLLMLMRGLQAAGSASTVALGAGIIADIATPAERGGFFGVFGVGPIIGPTIGPVIGGGLAQAFSWRAIFWFLCIASATCALGLFLLLPETLRSIVGDGSIPGGRIYTPPISFIGRHRVMNKSGERPPRKAFTNPLFMFTFPDVFILLVFGGTNYAVLYGVIATVAAIFQDEHPHLNETDIGLCFLSMGIGMLVGTVFSGKLMDLNYRNVRDEFYRHARTDKEKVDDKVLEKDDPEFPIEKARLQTVPYLVFIYAICVTGYGWSLHSNVSIALPLILHFIIGGASIAIISIVQALLVDLLPSQGSSITACNNVVRCSLGAGMVSVINPILVAFGNGWTYTFLGGICILASPLLFLELQYGPRWRERRRQKQEQAMLRHQ